jgi:hypothetical protein
MITGPGTIRECLEPDCLSRRERSENDFGSVRRGNHDVGGRRSAVAVPTVHCGVPVAAEGQAQFMSGQVDQQQSLQLAGRCHELRLTDPVDEQDLAVTWATAIVRLPGIPAARRPGGDDEQSLRIPSRVARVPNQDCTVEARSNSRRWGNLIPERSGVG